VGIEAVKQRNTEIAAISSWEVSPKTNYYNLWQVRLVTKENMMSDGAVFWKNKIKTK
jgi:hypothetical protein